MFDRTKRLLRGKLMKLLPKLQASVFQGVRVVSPIRPAGGNRHDDWVQERGSSQILQDLRVFIVLNAVTDGLEAYPRSGLGGPNRSGRIEKDAVSGAAARTAAARGGVHS